MVLEIVGAIIAALLAPTVFFILGLWLSSRGSTVSEGLPPDHLDRGNATTPTPEAGCLPLIIWVSLPLFGIGICMTVSGVAIKSILGELDDVAEATFLLMFSALLSFSVLQWAILRYRFGRAGGWLVMSLIGVIGIPLVSYGFGVLAPIPVMFFVPLWIAFTCLSGLVYLIWPSRWQTLDGLIRGIDVYERIDRIWRR